MTSTLVVLFVALTMTSPCRSQDMFCCEVKVVTGTGELDLDGKFTLDQINIGRDPACYDGCIYTRENREGEEYCFKAVNNGAMIEELCGVTATRSPDMAINITTVSGTHFRIIHKMCQAHVKVTLIWL